MILHEIYKNLKTDEYEISAREIPSSDEQLVFVLRGFRNNERMKEYVEIYTSPFDHMTFMRLSSKNLKFKKHRLGLLFYPVNVSGYMEMIFLPNNAIDPQVFQKEFDVFATQIDKKFRFFSREAICGSARAKEYLFLFDDEKSNTGDILLFYNYGYISYVFRVTGFFSHINPPSSVFMDNADFIFLPSMEQTKFADFRARSSQILGLTAYHRAMLPETKNRIKIGKKVADDKAESFLLKDVVLEYDGFNFDLSTNRRYSDLDASAFGRNGKEIKSSIVANIFKNTLEISSECSVYIEYIEFDIDGSLFLEMAMGDSMDDFSVSVIRHVEDILVEKGIEVVEPESPFMLMGSSEPAFLAKDILRISGGDKDGY